ncbi:MAG: hypothetical protein LBN10_08730 [Propionibacteriaceae bacterium]|jgi:hypothetical protein|nr:hypothetical protein [Propionibacteriaceae bacterium]
MTADTAHLAILIGAPGPADGIVDILQDLSAVGLITPWVWISADELPASEQNTASQQKSPPVPAWLIAEGCRKRLPSLTAYLSSLGGRAPERYLVGAVWAVSSRATDVDRKAVEHLIRSLSVASGSARIDRVRLILADQQSAVAADRPQGAEDSPAWNSYHNLLVEPVDLSGPAEHAVSDQWAPPPDASTLGRRAAPVVASVFGLWTGGDPAVLPERSANHTLRIVRSFHRRIDATTLEADLRAKVFETTDTLPTPQSMRAGEECVNDPQAVASMAEQVMAAHPRVFVGDALPDLSEPEGGLISAWERIKFFAGFWWRSTLSLPGTFMESVRSSWYGAAAWTVKQALDTPESRDTYYAGSYLEDGSPLAWQERVRAVDRAMTQVDLPALDANGSGARATETSSQLWQDIEGAVLTLADGMDRAFPASRDGIRRSFVAGTADIAPGPETGFAVPSPWNRSVEQGGISVERIGPASALLAEDATRRLRAMADQRGDDEARQVANRIEQWWEHQKQSFLGRLADRLKERFLTLERLSNDVGPDLSLEPFDFEAAVRRSRRVLRGILIATVVIALGLSQVTLGPEFLQWFPWPWSPILDTKTGAEAILGVLAAGLVASFGAFTYWQRKIFQALKQIRRRDFITPRLAQRRFHVASELRLVADASARLTSWAMVWGELLARPFGHDLGAVPGYSTESADNLPDAVKFAKAVVSPRVVAAAVTPVRNYLFRVGWLSGPAEALRREVGYYIIDQGPRILERDQFLRTDRADELVIIGGQLGHEDSALMQRGEEAFYGLSFDDWTTQSALPRWAGSVVKWGVPPNGAAELWKRCFVIPELGQQSWAAGGGLAAQPGPLSVDHPVRDEVLSDVEDSDGKRTMREFLVGLEPGKTISTREVDQSLLWVSKVGLNYEPADVVPQSVGLSTHVTLTQFSTPLQADETRLVTAPRPDGTQVSVQF